MNLPFKTWLPEGALHDSVAERALREVALAWSETWFARALVASIERRPWASCPISMDAGLQVRIHPHGLTVATSTSDRLMLASLMLDTTIVEPRLNDADRQLLADLVSTCLDDLCEQLGKAFSAEGDSTWDMSAEVGPGPEADVYSLGTVDGAPLVQVAIDGQAAVSLIKAHLPDPVLRPALGSIRNALAKQEVTVSALVGCCELSLSDLAGLASGDVVVLDRTIDQPLDLAIDRHPTSARCVVERTETRLNLKITKSLHG